MCCSPTDQSMWFLHWLDHFLHEHVATTMAALRSFTQQPNSVRNALPWKVTITPKVRQTLESPILTHLICILLPTEYLLSDTFLNSYNFFYWGHVTKLLLEDYFQMSYLPKESVIFHITYHFYTKAQYLHYLEVSNRF